MTETPQAEAERIIPRRVLPSLQEVYTDEGCLIWWRGRNRNLGGHAPADLWGRHAHASRRVLDEAQRLAAGNFA